MSERYTITDENGEVIFSGETSEKEALGMLISSAIASHFANEETNLTLDDVLMVEDDEG